MFDCVLRVILKWIVWLVCLNVVLLRHCLVWRITRMCLIWFVCWLLVCIASIRVFDWLRMFCMVWLVVTRVSNGVTTNEMEWMECGVWLSRMECLSSLNLDDCSYLLFSRIYIFGWSLMKWRECVGFAVFWWR